MRDPLQLGRKRSVLKKLKLNFHENGEAIKRTFFCALYDYNETISTYLPAATRRQTSGERGNFMLDHYIHCISLLLPLLLLLLKWNCEVKFNGK